MALRSSPVPMPEKRISFKKGSNGNIYVYYTLRAYRNKYGKPTSSEAAIGKQDAETGMLIPNRRYYEIFHSEEGCEKSKMVEGKSKSTAINRVSSCGTTYTLMELACRIGLRGIVEKSFPVNWDQILACAFYMLCEGNVMLYIGDWFDETDVPFTDHMDDHHCSRLFSSISYIERDRFFTEWVKFRLEQEYIAYDITSVSTYSKGIDIAEWGYNRDKEKLPQINIGMFYGAESRLPVYYDVYSGSVPDKSHLIFMMNGAEKLGISNVRFVIDRGFVKKDNLSFMAEKKYLFVTAFSGHLNAAKKIIDECKDSIRKAANRINLFDVYALPVDIDLYGFDMKAHVYYDGQKQVLDEKELYAHIERLGAELEKIDKKKRTTKKYTDFFIINEDGNSSFAQNNDKIDELLSRTGFFILLSNDESLNSTEVLQIYRGKDVIEKNFDQLKNGLDFKRLRTHLNATTDGKVFVAFIALILRSYMLNKIKQHEQIKHITLEKALRELRKIKVLSFEDYTRTLLPLTKLQKTILDAFHISNDQIIFAFS
ncbi:MAG: transposase [Bacteroidales bacterium]|nr:transposase [Bacteroidales bacterium]